MTLLSLLIPPDMTRVSDGQSSMRTRSDLTPVLAQHVWLWRSTLRLCAAPQVTTSIMLHASPKAWVQALPQSSTPAPVGLLGQETKTGV